MIVRCRTLQIGKILNLQLQKPQYNIHYSLWLSANVRNFSCRKSLQWLIYINSFDKTNYIVIPSSKMFNLKFHECLWDVMELFDFPIHFRQIWYKWPRRCVVFLWLSWQLCGTSIHRTVNKKQKKKLSLLTLASQQLVSFFFSCVNGVNIKIATKINNTCILRTIAAV